MSDTRKANDRPYIDFLILANHAEAVNGLLYISGAGWTDHYRPIVQGLPTLPNTHVGVAASVIIPWLATNEQHLMTIRLEDEGGDVMTRVDAHLSVGRPPTLPRGADQQVFIAFPVDVQLPHQGSYVVVAELKQEDGTEIHQEGSVKRCSFRVYDIPVPLQS